MKIRLYRGWSSAMRDFLHGSIVFFGNQRNRKPLAEAMQRHAWPPPRGSSKAVQMVIKQILEGARRFKPGSDARPAQRQRGFWRWPEWSRWSLARNDKYLIGIHPRRLPRV